MTILAFWPVFDELGWDRDEFETMDDHEAFKKLWENRDKNMVRLYDIESGPCHPDHYNLGYGDNMGDGLDFETDYNNEELDGGLWCKVLHVSSKYVGQLIDEEYE